MRLDLYQAETERLAREQAAMLDEARVKLAAGQSLSALEQAGIRNRIVHDYMNIDMALILDLVRTSQYAFIVDFLLQSIECPPSPALPSRP